MSYSNSIAILDMMQQEVENDCLYEHLDTMYNVCKTAWLMDAGKHDKC